VNRGAGVANSVAFPASIEAGIGENLLKTKGLFKNTGFN
jgi:hypothetical protein